MCVAGDDPDFSVFLGPLSLAQDPCVRSFPFCRRSFLSAARSSPIFFSFFLWFWKLVLEKRKSVAMLVSYFPVLLSPSVLKERKKRSGSQNLLLAVADDDDSVEGLSHQHCHCLLSSVLFFFYSPFSLFFPYALPLFFFFFCLCVFCSLSFVASFFFVLWCASLLWLLQSENGIRFPQ